MSDAELVKQADIVLSIVPPRDALTTARRIVEACRSTDLAERGDHIPALTYIDLNAISPRSAKTIASLIYGEVSSPPLPERRSSFPFRHQEPDFRYVPINFLDGGIIGGPPSLQADKTWKKPSVVISGPPEQALDAELSSVLNVKHISNTIGPASALKSCFASLGKGLIALAILSFTTAEACGVLRELQAHLEEFNPAVGAAAAGGLSVMPAKAYRWVEEMNQIAETFADQGDFGEGMGGKAVFNGISEIYKFVADETELTEEKEGNRKRGRTVEDVVKCIRDGMQKRRKSGAGDDEDLSLTWRGSWS